MIYMFVDVLEVHRVAEALLVLLRQRHVVVLDAAICEGRLFPNPRLRLPAHHLRAPDGVH